MAWIAALASLAGGALSAQGSKNAASASAAGSAQAIAEQRRQFDTIIGMQQPYATTGAGAMNALARLYGLPYSPYNGASAGSGAGYGNGITGINSGRSGTVNIPNPAGPLGFMDPITGWLDTKEPNYRYDPRNGTIDVNGAAGRQAGGYIDPNTGEAWVATPGTKNRDSALSDAVTNYLRTGEGSLDPNLGRFASAIGAMRQGGWEYNAPAAGTNADGTPSANGITTPSGPDMSSFFTSPDYNFRRDESLRGLERSAAARGGAFSGNALRATTDLAGNLASGEYGNYVNNLMRIANGGQGSANASSSAAQSTGTNISNLMQNAGNARASGISGQYDAWGNALGGAGYSLGRWYQGRNG